VPDILHDLVIRAQQAQVFEAISSFCWAMDLRILRRHLEHGESVPRERRLDA